MGLRPAPRPEPWLSGLGSGMRAGTDSLALEGRLPASEASGGGGGGGGSVSGGGGGRSTRGGGGGTKSVSSSGTGHGGGSGGRDANGVGGGPSSNASRGGDACVAFSWRACANRTPSRCAPTGNDAGRGATTPPVAVRSSDASDGGGGRRRAASSRPDVVTCTKPEWDAARMSLRREEAPRAARRSLRDTTELRVGGIITSPLVLAGGATAAASSASCQDQHRQQLAVRQVHTTHATTTEPPARTASFMTALTGAWSLYRTESTLVYSTFCSGNCGHSTGRRINTRSVHDGVRAERCSFCNPMRAWMSATWASNSRAAR